MSPSSFQRNVGKRRRCQWAHFRALVCARTYIRNPVLRDLGMDIYTYMYTSMRLSRWRRCSLIRLESQERVEETWNEGIYFRDMKTWRLWKCREYPWTRGKGTVEAENEKSDRIGREIPQRWWNGKISPYKAREFYASLLVRRKRGFSIEIAHWFNKVRILYNVLSTRIK